jgi:hypothetical protein
MTPMKKSTLKETMILVGVLFYSLAVVYIDKMLGP